MEDKQITPVEALTVISDTMKSIPVDATLHVNCYVLDALSKINETAKAGLQAASQPSIGMPSLDKPILTDEDVRAWEESETSRPPAGFEKIPFDPNRLKQMEGHEERAEKSWEEIQKRLSQPPAVKAIDATPFESNTERHSVTGLTTGAVWVKASRIKIDDLIHLYADKKVFYKFNNDEAIGTGMFYTIDQFVPLNDFDPIYREEFDHLEIIDESPTAAGGTIQIDYDWLALALADFATTYHASKNKDLMNDVAEFLSDRLKGKGVEYVLDENERATAAGDGKEAMEFAIWLCDNGWGCVAKDQWMNGYIPEPFTTAELYDYYLTDKNK